jgi:hypothetical protein
MSSTQFEKLTADQEALVPVIRDNWKAILLSTQRLNRQQAEEAVKTAYALIGMEEPEILFFDSPYGAFRELKNQTWNHLGTNLAFQLWSQIAAKLKIQLDSQLKSKLLINELDNQLKNQLWQQVGRQLYSQLWTQLHNQMLSRSQYRHISPPRYMQHLGENIRPLQPTDNCITTSFAACHCSWYDFCISILNLDHNQRQWKVLQALVKYCDWIFPYERVCFVCDRPIKISLDSQNRLHEEREPAIQFDDGYSLYAYQGVILPEEYGVFSPQKWQAKWILEERNVEVRRVLIKGIGYARICQELQAKKLDYWNEYTLLRIDKADIEPIYLLKMTCPSTGRIHVLRTPSNMKSAREAICWVNWGVAPEDFAVQT